jgi:FdhE protein
MQFGERDQKILSDLEEAKRTHQDLKEVLDFYESLFQIQFSFKSHLRASDRSRAWEEKEIKLQRLAEGLPQIQFEELPIQPAPLLALYRNIVRLLAKYTGSAQDWGPDPVPDEIIAQAYRIFQNHGPLVHPGPLEDFVSAVSGLVLAPYLQLACERIQPRIPLDSWHRSSCPICGGRPSFAALTSDTAPRTLMCPRCFGEWMYPRIGCPFCNAKDAQSYFPGDDGRYRLYVCGFCHRYLKTVDLRERGPDMSLPVANLVTVSMDIAAQKEGYDFH